MTTAAFTPLRSHACRIVALLITLLGSTIPISADDVDLVNLRGQKVAGVFRSWSDQQIVVEGETAQSHSVWDVRNLSFRRPAEPLAAGSPLIQLTNGDRLVARAQSVVDDQITISWPLLPSIQFTAIPLEKVTSLIFELPTTPESRTRLFADLNTFPPGSDLVMLRNDDRTTGEFQNLDSAFVEMKSGNSLLKLDRSKVRSIRLNPELATVVRPPKRRILIRLSDGSRITASDVRSAKGSMIVRSKLLGDLTFPLTAISSCEIYSERFEPVSDREPSRYEFTPFLSMNWPRLTNSSVLHGPLMLRGIEYTSGIGTHSRSRMTYALQGHERAFIGVVGIDDIAKGAGSAVFSIELDGRIVWKTADVTGTAASIVVPQIDLRGGKELTLIVDFGQFGDVGDYANWCDAMFICDSTTR